MRNSAPTDTASSAGSPLDAFTGTFSPTKTGPLYNAGLMVVAFAMILLPLIYLSPIALSVAEHARSEKPAENDWHRTYLDSDSHVDRLFALNYRLVGRVLAAAESAEKILEAGDASNASPTA